MRRKILRGFVAAAVTLGAWATSTHAQCPPIRTFDGERAEDYMGYTVANAGDIDGDGCADVLTGSFGYEAADGQETTGKAYVFSGATGEVLRSWVGEAGAFGIIVAGAGDVDGDAIPDVIIAAPTFWGQAGTWAGKVYVYSGRTGALIWSWEGDLAEHVFGSSVAGPGDLDGDGHADIVVGQPGFSSPDIPFPGKVFAYSGATGQELWTRLGESPADHLGWSVSGAGDFNGDGFPDVISGAPGRFPGKVYVLSGPTGEVVWDQETPPPDFGDGFGGAVGGGGDMNGDGFDDVIVGAFAAGGDEWYSDNGQAYVFTGPHGDLLWTWTGELFGEFFGFSVAGAGDTDGDGVPDAVVGAYGHYGPAGYASGRAYVFSGATGKKLAAWNGERSVDIFGYGVAGGGDVDGDGRSDVIVGAKWADFNGLYSGRAYVFRVPRHGDCNCDAGASAQGLVAFTDCLSGPVGMTRDRACGCADYDNDDDVDMKDFGTLQEAMTNK